MEGRDLDLAIIGDPAAQRKVWIIARQHPGETMAEWCAEGLIEALLDRANPFARRLLQQTAFYIVPNMNPDGAARGNLRTNAAGANLNREWSAPSLERSPEVYAVRQRIHETGIEHDRAVAGFVEQVFGTMAQLHHRVQTEEACAALHRVERAEHRVQQIDVARRGLEVHELFAQAFQQLARLDQEDVEQLVVQLHAHRALRSRIR